MSCIQNEHSDQKRVPCLQSGGGEFDWDKEVTNWLLGAFFLGYLVLQVVGGWISDQFGSKRALTFGMGVAVLCTLLIPVCAR